MQWIASWRLLEGMCPWRSAARTVFLAGFCAALVRAVPLNQIQVLGTHNSFHIAPGNELQAIRAYDSPPFLSPVTLLVAFMRPSHHHGAKAVNMHDSSGCEPHNFSNITRHPSCHLKPLYAYECCHRRCPLCNLPAISSSRFQHLCLRDCTNAENVIHVHVICI